MNEQQQGMGSGLTRYRSAPSSCFASLLEGGEGFGSDDFERLFNPRASSPETQRIFSRFMNSGEESSVKLQSNNYPMFDTPPIKADGGDNRVLNLQVEQNNNNNNKIEEEEEEEGCTSTTNSLGLIRHSSSPAGLFANIDIHEFGAVRSMGNFGGGSNVANAEATFCSTSSSMFKTPKTMDPITELIEPKANWDDIEFPVNSWDDIHQKNEGGSRLSHHLSLPKSFTELSPMGMEKLLQDSVPCKIRAKRGCATHPRSIAERVRRTKISDRMRKLQELVPNMEKQTNTSDMLDLAVEYIKELQGQLKMLSDDRENCSCEAKLG